MHFVAGNPVRPALTSARYSLCRRKISSLRSGLLLRPRPLTATPSGHWGPIPQYLHAVCKSPPYQAAQYFWRIFRSQMGLSMVSRPWLRRGKSRSKAIILEAFWAFYPFLFLGVTKVPGMISIMIYVCIDEFAILVTNLG